VLREATAANPKSSALWIALGLALEQSGETIAARKALDEAMHVDRQYLPAWTMANFAFRHRDRDAFWSAARHAAAMAYDNPRPLIELADTTEPDPVAALSRLDGSPALERAYLDFLIGADRWDGAEQVARRMLERRRTRGSPDPGTDARLASFTTRLLERHRIQAAVEIWNGVAGFPEIDMNQGSGILNGDFDREPSGQGFEWRLVPHPGVTASWRPRSLRIALSGTQPEVCPLLEQWITVGPRKYTLSYEYRLQTAAANSGLHWAWGSTVSPPVAPSNEWRSTNWEFTPGNTSVAQLRLIHRREPGSTRASGTFVLRRVRLELVPQPEKRSLAGNDL